MKYSFKKAISVLLALCLVIPCIFTTSCSVLTADNSPAALTLDGHKITEAMYNYWACVNKAQYLYTYTDIEDTEEFWSGDIKEGVSAAEYLDGITLDAIKATLVAKMLFDKYDLSFTSSEKQSVSDFVADLVKEYADGDKSMMNTALKEYGIDLNILESIYLEEEKAAKVYDHLFGDGGKTPLSDSDYETFYQENYVHFQMIYINNMYQYTMDDDGNRVTDDNGYYITEELDAEAKAEKDAIIKTIEDSLAQGGDFNALYEEYSETKAYSNGYYYTAAESYDDALYYQLVIEAQNLEIGEYSVFESDSGTCIIKKLDLDSGAWKESANSDFFGNDSEYIIDLATEIKYRELVESYFDDIVVDEEIISKYSVANITPCYSF